MSRNDGRNSLYQILSVNKYSPVDPFFEKVLQAFVYRVLYYGYQGTWLILFSFFYFIGVTGKRERERERERVFFGRGLFGVRLSHLPKLRGKPFFLVGETIWRKIRAGNFVLIADGHFLRRGSGSRERGGFPRGLLRLALSLASNWLTLIKDGDGCLDRETVERSWWELRQEVKIDYRPGAGTIKRRVSGWKKTNSDVLRDRERERRLDNKLWQLKFPSFPPR